MKMKSNLRYALTALALSLCACVSAQKENTGVIRTLADNGYKISLRAGYNLGGTTPLPIPDEVESVNSFDPGLNLSIGVTVEKMFTDKWGAQAAIRFESKGMDTKVTVANYHTTLTRDGDQTTGNYTGKESTTVKYSLITIPLLAHYKFNERWSVSLGPYFSYAIKKEFSGMASEGYMRTLRPDPLTGAMVPTGDRVDIPADNPASYDFSGDMRRFMYGLEAGVDWQCFRHFMVFAYLDWGLNDTFKDSFKETITFAMYPIYGSIGFGYSF